MPKYQTYKVGIKINGKLAKRKMHLLIHEKCLEAKECMEHKFNYAFFTDRYRLYRRGKNRCKRCGVKLEALK